MSLPLLPYLATLRMATPANHPYTARDKADEIGVAFTAMALGVVDFIEVSLREDTGIDYTEARQTLEELLRFMPEAEEPSPEDLLNELGIVLRRAIDGADS